MCSVLYTLYSYSRFAAFVSLGPRNIVYFIVHYFREFYVVTMIIWIVANAQVYYLVLKTKSDFV